MSKRSKTELLRPLDEGSKSDWSLSGDWQRIVSLIIAIGYLVVWTVVLRHRSLSRLMAGAIIGIVALAFPLACIWFAEEVAEYVSDRTVFHQFTSPSQGRFVRWGGWMLLLLPAFLVLVVWLLDFTYRL
jgi:uncharacterized membrane protein YoaT (DUF817 family)